MAYFDDDPDRECNRWWIFKWFTDDNPFSITINKVALVIFSLVIGAEILYLIIGTLIYGVYL